MNRSQPGAFKINLKRINLYFVTLVVAKTRHEFSFNPDLLGLNKSKKYWPIGLSVRRNSLNQFLLSFLVCISVE